MRAASFVEQALADFSGSMPVPDPHHLASHSLGCALMIMKNNVSFICLANAESDAVTPCAAVLQRVVCILQPAGLHD